MSGFPSAGISFLGLLLIEQKLFFLRFVVFAFGFFWSVATQSRKPKRDPTSKKFTILLFIGNLIRCAFWLWERSKLAERNEFLFN